MSPGTVSPLAGVRALTFDIFGTAVDWRASVTEELVLRAHRKASSGSPLPERLQSLQEGDWARFAQEWRNAYLHFVKTFDPHRDEWKSVDEHHRDSLKELLAAWSLAGLYTDSEIQSLSLVWHRLSPWPDAAPALSRLKASGRLRLATLSNANTDLIRDVVDFAGLEFDELFCAETFRAYKPRPETYLGAARQLRLAPGQVAMVACHLKDLRAARDCGLRTIYVERPDEEEWDKNGEEFRGAVQWVDLWIDEREGGFDGMAERLLHVVE